jgi:hypothetical protein
VFLRRQWENHLVPLLRPQTRRLELFRPATVDLVLTKMRRGDDPQDLADVQFLLEHDRITSEQLEAAFADVVLPPLEALRAAFA